MLKRLFMSAAAASSVRSKQLRVIHSLGVVRSCSGSWKGRVWPAQELSASHGPVGQRIVQKVTEAFRPVHLDLVNESYKHNVPRGSESHFKVLVVSDAFDGKKILDRHRMVNECLADELEGSVHALSISAKTPAQWTGGASMHETPACRGGAGR